MRLNQTVGISLEFVTAANLPSLHLWPGRALEPQQSGLVFLCPPAVSLRLSPVYASGEEPVALSSPLTHGSHRMHQYTCKQDGGREVHFFVVPTYLNIAPNNRLRSGDSRK